MKMIIKYSLLFHTHMYNLVYCCRSNCYNYFIPFLEIYSPDLARCPLYHGSRSPPPQSGRSGPQTSSWPCLSRACFQLEYPSSTFLLPQKPPMPQRRWQVITIPGQNYGNSLQYDRYPQNPGANSQQYHYRLILAGRQQPSFRRITQYVQVCIVANLKRLVYNLFFKIEKRAFIFAGYNCCSLENRYTRNKCSDYSIYEEQKKSNYDTKENYQLGILCIELINSFKLQKESGSTPLTLFYHIVNPNIVFYSLFTQLPFKFAVIK